MPAGSKPATSRHVTRFFQSLNNICHHSPQSLDHQDTLMLYTKTMLPLMSQSTTLSQLSSHTLVSVSLLIPRTLENYRNPLRYCHSLSLDLLSHLKGNTSVSAQHIHSGKDHSLMSVNRKACKNTDKIRALNIVFWFSSLDRLHSAFQNKTKSKPALLSPATYSERWPIQILSQGRSNENLLSSQTQLILELRAK